jgi:enterochelin esterase-like enzyme
MYKGNLSIKEKTYSTLKIEEKILYSEYLQRDVIIDIYLPHKADVTKGVDLLLINDGQDLKKMVFADILDPLIFLGHIKPIMYAAVHCGADRMNEYGTVCSADYKGRGARAGLYNKFILEELLPFIKIETGVSCFNQKSFAGFSLGGLSALDIVWNNCHEFTNVGVFSGSLWWRRRGYEDEGYDWDKDRIMHLQVQNGKYHPSLRFFFECGCLDETADRNNNGIIDAIEDTTDLIEDLKNLGYNNDQIYYLQLEDGEHNIETWARAFPAFLKWGWGKL